MTAAAIEDFHAHIYFDPAQLHRAKALAAEMAVRFGVPVGHFHNTPVGPHPRGSVQLTVPVAQFGEVAIWLSVNRAGLTVFAHASTRTLDSAVPASTAQEPSSLKEPATGLICFHRSYQALSREGPATAAPCCFPGQMRRGHCHQMRTTDG